MAKNLVIVESPTKAKTITKMLGPNYKVLATVGHLRDLPKSKIGVDIDNNFEPQYINVRGRAKTINELKKEAEKADKVFLATDPDREGEAISWHLAYLLGLDLNDANRVTFNEITTNFVKEAIHNPRPVDMRLVDAQQARRVLDRIVGYKLSPILWKKVKNGLSAGRVQSVALKLICDREKKINAFTPVEYWEIKAFHEKEKMTFESKLFAVLKDGKRKKTNIQTEDQAVAIMNSLNPKAFNVIEIKKTKRLKHPPTPFTTSTLQQEASKKLGFSTSKTMQIAQQLYEGISLGKEGNVGLISYMRTDSTRISSNTVKDVLSYVNEKYGKKYAGKGNEYNKRKAGAQDAHEAIRPSSIYKVPNEISMYLSPDQLKLYDFIWRRTVASQMTPAQYESTALILENHNYLFRSNGNIMLLDGFLKVLIYADNETILPSLKENESVNATKIEKSQHFTKPPARFTEASLVKALEEDGIGRPSTYSSIIRSILSRNYVVLEKKFFVPTEIGNNVNDLLSLYFSAIINEEFTASMEKNLDSIVEDHADWKTVIDAFYRGFDPLLEKALKSDDNYRIEDEVLDEKCPECGHNLIIKNGRNGKFIGCSGFPVCKYIRPIVKTIGVNCPKCGHDLVEKVSKRGKVFYGCNNYPACSYASWNKPIGRRCPKCDDLLTLKKNRYGEVILCNNENCNYEETVQKK